MAHPIVIAPRGELELVAARGLARDLTAAAGQLEAPVVLDLSAVSFIDSTGLGAVVQASGRMERNGRRLEIIAPPGSRAAALLELTGLDSRLAVHPTRDGALAALRGERVVPEP